MALGAAQRRSRAASPAIGSREFRAADRSKSARRARRCSIARAASGKYRRAGRSAIGDGESSLDARGASAKTSEDWSRRAPECCWSGRPNPAARPEPPSPSRPNQSAGRARSGCPADDRDGDCLPGRHVFKQRNQRAHRRRRVGKSLRRIADHALCKPGVEARRDRRTQAQRGRALARRGDRLEHHLAQEHRQAAAAVRRAPIETAGQQIEREQAHRPDIGRGLDVRALFRLLRRHPARRAHRPGPLGLRLTFLHQLGDAEVEDLEREGRAVAAGERDEEILRLEIAMDEAEAVRFAEPVSELAEDLQHLARRQAAGAAHPRRRAPRRRAAPSPAREFPSRHRCRRRPLRRRARS